MRQYRADLHRKQGRSILSVSHCRTSRSSTRQTSWGASVGSRLQTSSGSLMRSILLHSAFLLRVDRAYYVNKQSSATSCSPEHNIFCG